jgi:hypothetical protein
MNRRTLELLSLTAVSGLIAHPSSAHHSYAMFALDRNLTLEGEITKLEWANPHVYIEIVVDGAERERWQVQGEAPGAMALLGWSPQSLVPGERVRILGVPLRRPTRNMALGAAVIKADGSSLGMRPGAPPPPSAEHEPPAGLAGRWLTEADAALVDAFLDPAGTWRLTPAGAAAAASYRDSENPAKDCVPEPVPYAMVWSATRSIETGPDGIVIRDSLGVERTIHLDRESHDGAEYAPHGHSIGRFEAGVLVVDTRRFQPHRRGNGWGLPSGPRKRLQERFEPSADGATLTYSFSLDDPDYLAEPVTGTLRLSYRPDLPLVDEPCDIDVARRYLEQP